MKLLFNYRARNFRGRWIMPSSNAGWSTAASLHARVLQGYADELQMLAQQYADDKESGAVKSAGNTRKRSSNLKPRRWYGGGQC